MIDKIAFTITDPAAKVWRLNAKPENVSKRGADLYTGKIRNLKIWESLDGVFVSGSVAKFLNGENITPLTLKTYSDGLKLIENETGLDLHKAILKQCEFGTSIPVNNPVSDYLRNFGILPRFGRSTYETTDGIESVLYSTKSGNREFYAYDKIHEMKSKKSAIPELYENSNVIRLEYRIKKRAGVKSLLGKEQDLSPYDLANYENYRNLAGQFWAFYDTIPKVGRQVFLSSNEETTPKELNDILAESYRQAHPKEYSALIQQCKERGLLTEKSLERIRAIERKNGQNYAFSDTNELIAELNEKMRCRAFYGA